MTTLAPPHSHPTAPALAEAARRDSAEARERARSRLGWLEPASIFAVVSATDLACAWYLVVPLHFISVDGLAGVANAFFVLFSRDPHLAAIGLVLNPLPSFLELPLVALKGWLPWLVGGSFAGSVETAGFSAGSAVVISLLLREVGANRWLRLLGALVWLGNPMVLFYSANGMSDMVLMFFVLLSGLLLLRWLRQPSDQLLVGLGVTMAVATLVRYEAWVFAALVLPLLVLREWRRGTPRRAIEARVLLYGLPVAMAVLFWIGANWVVMHAPLDFLTNVYGDLSQTHAIGSRPMGWGAALGAVLDEVSHLYPTYLVCLALALVAGLRSRQLGTAVLVCLFSASALLVMGYLAHRGSLDPLLRYFMTAIPASFVLLAYALGRLPGRRTRLLVGTTVLLLLGASNAASLVAMDNTTLGGPGMEHAVVSAALSGAPVADDSFAGRIHQEVSLGRELARLDPHHRLILLDTFLGFPIVVNSPDPRLFVITSDQDFEAALNDPAAYHVAYFLVPQPWAEGKLDAIDRRYPGFWRDGDGFAHRVAQLVGAPDSYRWRLYRIVATPPQ